MFMILWQQQYILIAVIPQLNLKMWDKESQKYIVKTYQMIFMMTILNIILINQLKDTINMQNGTVIQLTGNR